MAAGVNLVVSVWTFGYPVDDSIGGAQPTGTVSYENIMARYEPVPPTIPLLEQGVETVKLFNFFVSRADIHIKENDELQIKAPLNHEYAGQFFRVVSVRPAGFHPSDNRGSIKLITRRREEAHGIQSI